MARHQRFAGGAAASDGQAATGGQVWRRAAGASARPRPGAALEAALVDGQAARHDQATANDGSVAPSPPAAPADRGQLRLRSLTWALLAGLTAGALALAAAAALPAAVAGGGAALEAGLRAGGCGFFYGLLAFHLQRVDPDDSHLQAGLVGAVCGLRSLAQPLPAVSLATLQPAALPSLMMELLATWLPLWLPLIGSALLLHSIQRVVPFLRP